MLDFGVGGGAPSMSEGLKTSLQPIFFYDLKKSINMGRVDFCKAVKYPQQLILSKCLAWERVLIVQGTAMKWINRQE